MWRWTWLSVGQGLAGANKAAGYVVTEIDVNNPQAFGKEYAPKAQASIKAAGGRALARGGLGGAGARRIVAIEGPAPERVALLEFADMDGLKKWRDSDAYKAARVIGDKYASFKTFAVEGFDK